MTDNTFNKDDCFDFITSLIDQNQLSKTLARNIKTAIRSVTQFVFIDDMTVEDINIGEIISRYKELAKDKISDSTVKQYANNFTNGMGLYIDHCKNPDAVIKPKKKVVAKKKASKKSKVLGGKAKEIAVAQVLPTQIIEVMQQPAQTCVFPVPLRPNLIVELSNLPHDLTVKEATKICGVIKALSEG